MQNIFSHSLKKPVIRENWDILSVCLSILIDTIYSDANKSHLGLGNMEKLVLWFTTNKNVREWGWKRSFWGSERKCFTHNPGLGGNASLVVSRVNAHSLSIQSTAALLDVWTLPSWPGVANFNKLEVSVVNENLALCPSLNL